VCDEAQDMSDDDQEALLSASSASPLLNPQWIYTGTPPGPKANGEVFTRIRAEALGGKSRRQTWHEWSCEGSVDLDDPLEWHRANPALGTRVLLDVVQSERSNLSDTGFGRERLGMWEEASTSRVIDLATWAERASQVRPVDRFALAVDVSPDRSTASVSFAGQRPDGDWHVELSEQRNGVGWVSAFIVERCELNTIRAVIVDGASPAAPLVDQLKSLGIKVTTTGARDMAQACGNFYDGAMDGWLHHFDQPQLNAAVGAARKRSIGDAWGWNRKNSASDITPLVSCTLALWGAQSSTVKRPNRSNSGRRVVVLA